MRIGLISREYPPETHVGGIATYSKMAAKLLVDHGHEVHVFCNGPSTIIQNYGRLYVHRIKMSDHPLPNGKYFYYWRHFVRTHLSRWLDSITWSKTVAYYIKHKIDITQFNVLEWPETNGEGAYLPKLSPHIQGICRIHTSWLDDPLHHPLERWLLIRLQKRACQKATVIVSPSKAMAIGYAAKILKLKQSVKVSRNPMSSWQLPIAWPNKKRENILYLGRIEYRKGVDILMEAFHAIRNESKSGTLRLVGSLFSPIDPGDQQTQFRLQNELSQQITDPEYPFKIEYLGNIDHNDLHIHLDWAGLLVMPSRMDNYPYVILEALSRGCCVLASDIGGIREICGGMPFSRLIKPGDSASLTQEMREWIEDTNTPEPLWHQAEEYAKIEFGEEAGYQRLIQLYESKSES
jgi:glycosyltransferase involved in cell wall biosynthesis